MFLQTRLSDFARSSSILERARQKDANSSLESVSVAIEVAFLISHPSRNYALLEPTVESGNTDLYMSENYSVIWQLVAYIRVQDTVNSWIRGVHNIVIISVKV